MKAAMISIRPEWCAKIANGTKTIEVRKTKPKLETPFKCYIYCTRNYPILWKDGKNFYQGNSQFEWLHFTPDMLNGKVIGEFVCDFIAEYEAELWDDETYERIQERYESEDFPEYGEYEYKTVADNGDDFWKENMLCKASCLTVEELRKYLGAGFSDFYGWHISELKIYDKPRELGEFRKPCVYGDKDISCFLCDKSAFRPDMHIDCFNFCNKAPQSWCYVEGYTDE